MARITKKGRRLPVGLSSSPQQNPSSYGAPPRPDDPSQDRVVQADYLNAVPDT